MKQDGSPHLFDGAMIVYEKKDLMGILDFLSFLISYKKFHGKEDEVPEVFLDKNKIEPEKLLAFLNNFPSSTDGKMQENVITEILDAHHEFFKDYMEHLEGIIAPHKKRRQDDKEHTLFPTYSFFLYIETEFFPLLQDMH